MKTFRINRRNNNLELVSKIMNSVCAKYDCRIKYNAESGTVHYSGDDVYKTLIAEETMKIFMKK